VIDTRGEFFFDGLPIFLSLLSSFFFGRELFLFRFFGRVGLVQINNTKQKENQKRVEPFYLRHLKKTYTSYKEWE